LDNKEIIIIFVLSKGTKSLTINFKAKCQRREMLNEALEKWKAAYEALLGIGLPLDED